MEDAVHGGHWVLCYDADREYTGRGAYFLKKARLLLTAPMWRNGRYLRGKQRAVSAQIGSKNDSPHMS